MSVNRWETILSGVTLAEGATTYLVDNLDAKRGRLWVTTSAEGGAAVLVVEYRFQDGLGNASRWETLSFPPGIVEAETSTFNLHQDYAGLGRLMEFRCTVSGTSTPTWTVDLVLEYLAS